MNRILIVDQATINTAYTVCDVSGDPTWICCSILKISRKNKNAVVRMIELYDKLAEVIDEYNIDTLVVEAVPLSRKSDLNVTTVLVKLLGMMEMLAIRKNIDIEIMNVINWKFLAGIKKAKREQQKQHSIVLAMERWAAFKEIIVNSDDVADCLNMSYAFLKKHKKI